MEKSVLLIDDDARIRNLVNRILAANGFRVQEAMNGLEGLEILKSAEPSLVICDQNMPVMDGLSFLRAVRTDLKCDVPILMMSGNNDDKLRRTCYELGVYDFINKPEDADILVARAENGIKIAELIEFRRELKRDLRVSGAILKRMAPPEVLELNHFTLNSYNENLMAVGGDICLALATETDNPVFLVGDITGHGISAALFSIFIDVAARRAHRESLLPHKILNRLNRELAEYMPSHYFVTMLCFSFDRRRQQLLYANAGHPGPIARLGGTVSQLDAPRFPVLGVRAQQEYQATAIPFNPGDWFLAYTDGVFDTFDGKQYIEDTSIAKISQMGHAGPETWLQIRDYLATQQGCVDDRTAMLLTAK